MSRMNGDTSLEMHLLTGQSKAIVCLRGHLTTETVGKLAGLSPKLEAPRLVELDLSDLNDIDDDGVRALQFLERRVAGRGSLFLVSHPLPTIRRQLNRGGVRSLLAPSFPRRRVTYVIPVEETDASQAG